MTRFLLLFSFLLFSIHSFEQVVMSNGVFQTCGGAFLDSGGQGGPGYSNNENLTCTICPDVPGDVITVDFITFDLDNAGAQNTWDWMSIYDGDNTTAGTLGTYYGTDLQGLFVTATPLNTSGCLTFVFHSNANGTGNFGGTITCDTPCDRPTAVASYDAPLSRRICVGDVINFDGSASFPGAGFNITEWLWDFADGTTDSSGPIVSHSWDEPGEYVVELYLVDDNGCSSTNRVSLQLLVSTYPSWSPFPDDTFLCLGEDACFEAFPDDYEVTWLGPEATYSNPVSFELPDNVGECFESEIEVSGFAPGQTITTITDLLSIDASLQHSFLFDLVITIECPSGESVILHQQMTLPDGGTTTSSGADLGVPDAEFYDYSWAANAPNGTWSEEANGGTGVTTLPAGTYSTIQPMEQLIGCDLNGTWSISICDLWGGDDGMVESWGLSFNPAIIPDVTEFTPDIGFGSDSSYWSFNPAGLNVLSQGADGNSVCILPTETGTWPFTYTVTNNHGCTTDSTFLVTVTQTFADAGEDFVWCGDETILVGGVQGAPTPVCSSDAGDYSYCYGNSENTVFTYCPNTPGDGVTFMGVLFNSGFLEVFFDDITIYDGPDVTSPVIAGPLEGDISGQLFVATNPDGCITFRITSDGSVSCASGNFGPIEYTVGCDFTGPDLVWEWSPATGLSDPNIQQPVLAELSVPTTYTLTVYPPGRPECATTDEVTVYPGYAYTFGFVQPECFEPTGEIFANIDGATGNAPWDVWIEQNGTIVASQQTNGGLVTFTELMPDVYTLHIANADCERVEDIDMAVPVPVFLTPSADVTICIDGSATLTATPSSNPAGLQYFWTGSNNHTNSIVVSPVVDAVYEVYGIFGSCYTDTVDINVSVRDSLHLELAEGGTICYGDSIFINASVLEGGLAPYNVEWTGAGITLSQQGFFVSPIMTANYCCTLTDACETPAVTECVLIEVAPLVDPTFEVDTLGGCRPVMVDFTGLAFNPEEIASVLWEFGDGSTSTSVQNTSHTYTTQGLFDVTYSITTLDGCFYQAVEEDLISIYNWPVAGFSMDPQTAVLPNTEIEFTNQSFGATELTWVIADLDTLQGLNPTYQFPLDQIGTYPVQLIAANEWGCVDTTLLYAVVVDEFVMYIPNAFTPDQDGVNDVFRFEGIDVDKDDFVFQVFNRWGEVVYETHIFEQGWDGSVQGGDYYVPDGMYVYRVETKSLTTQERKEIIGTVLIIR